ncbi:unnamed protein product [Pedinophyceae sp. YPF-701]|nr:unnamed protein product [Pedinophyceae sp. YPF-701]
MLGFSTTTWAIILGVGYVASTGRDARLLTRGLGYYTGRAVGFALHMRSKFLGNNPLWQVQNEIWESLWELQSVKNDIRQATARRPYMSRPPTFFTERVDPGANPADRFNPNDSGGAAARGAAPEARGEQPAPQSTAAAFTAEDMQRVLGTSGAVRSAGGTSPGTGDSAPSATGAQPDARAQGSDESGAGWGPGPAAWGATPPPAGAAAAAFIDVSASDVGKAGHGAAAAALSGTDILADALDEEEVAAVARRAIRRPDAPPPPR